MVEQISTLEMRQRLGDMIVLQCDQPVGHLMVEGRGGGTLRRQAHTPRD
jgi:hypothetical protein